MRTPITVLIAAVCLILAIPASAALSLYTQNFEALTQTDPAALSGDGWVVYGNVYDAGGSWIYGYGTFPAPNDGAAFCQIDVGQGGDEQGAQQLVVFSDYQNGDHAVGNLIEANVFQEWPIEASDVGDVYSFAFQAKRGNIEGTSTALAFIKTIDPASGWATTNFITADMTAIPDTWGGYELILAIDEGLVGQLLQIGFSNTTTGYLGTGIFYDNIVFQKVATTTDVPGASAAATLGRNYPNPFNPSTRIGFSLARDTRVDLAVFDLAGRRVATLAQGPLAAGDHRVTWDGRTDLGGSAPAGMYRYVLVTPTERTSRSMILLK